MAKETSSMFTQDAEGSHHGGKLAHISWGLLQHPGLDGGMPGVPSPGPCAIRGLLLGCNQQSQARVQTPQRGTTVRWQLPRPLEASAGPQLAGGRRARQCCHPPVLLWFPESLCALLLHPGQVMDCVVGCDKGKDMHKSDFLWCRASL